MSHVRVEARGAIAVVTVDRPPANAMDIGLLEDGHAALEWAQDLHRGM